MKMPRRAFLKALVLTAVTALAGLASAKPIAAQDLDIAIDRERMVEFVRVHIAVNDVRDEFHGAVARVHDPEGRIRAREEVETARVFRFDPVLDRVESLDFRRDVYGELLGIEALDLSDRRAAGTEILPQGIH